MDTRQSADLRRLIRGYQLCAATEGKSRSTISIVTSSVTYFIDFVTSQGASGDATEVSHLDIREFILYLQQKPCFSSHRFTRPQDKGLSAHTVNCYLRSLRMFFSWLMSEKVIDRNPFDRVKMPRVPRKVMPTFTDSQIQSLLNSIPVKSAQGYRDYTIIMTLLDTGMRVSELCNLKLADVQLEDGMVKVMGKGNKERVIPIGKQVQRFIWHYLTRSRPEPAGPNCDYLFLTREGRQLTKDRIEAIIARHGVKAGLVGVRCSPHTFRHTAAVKFLRNGGGVFSLQRLLGHSSLDMTRHYCEIADVDVKTDHITASPVDNLSLRRGTIRAIPSNEQGARSTAHRGCTSPQSRRAQRRS
jgi:site-specific recombinase XerD